MFKSGDYHVKRNVGQHYHPDDHEHNNYKRIDIYDDDGIYFHKFKYDDFYKHNSSKF